jgi:CofD-related protein of GAK system
MRKLIRNHLRFFQEAMPADFDLRGANIGNLILVGGYLNQGRHLDPVIFLFSQLVEVCGVVRPVLGRSLHLAAELEDGTRFVGQHLLTGKEVAPITSAVRQVYLARGPSEPARVGVPIRKKTRDLIGRAEVICYPMGSFYSSLVATLLPAGVGDAIAACDAPKVYVPNLGEDPEQLGMTVGDAVERLLEYLLRSSTSADEVSAFLHYVLTDSNALDISAPDASRIERLGVRIVDVPTLGGAESATWDSEQLARLLVSLA